MTERDRDTERDAEFLAEAAREQRADRGENDDGVVRDRAAAALRETLREARDSVAESGERGGDSR